MFTKQHSKPQNRIDTLVGLGTRIDGNIQFSGGLRVDGEINGNIIAAPGKPSTLVLSEHGQIDGAISVSHAVINGVVVGPLSARAYVELQAKSRVTGDVCYKSLEMHMGAVVEGKLIYQNDAAGVIPESSTQD